MFAKTKADLLEKIEKMDEDNFPMVLATTNANDIYGIACNDFHTALGEQRVERILEKLERNFDSSEGISYDVIRQTIDNYLSSSISERK
jgi:hypothetical protein